MKSLQNLISQLNKQNKYSFKALKGLAFLVLFGISSCGNDDPVEEDPFDRKALLENWVDNFIISDYAAFANAFDEMKLAIEALASAPEMENLDKARNAYAIAYASWQSVSMYNVKLADEERLREYLNTYPCDTDNLEAAVQNKAYNLSLLSTIDRQGFPAIDYLLFGIGVDDEEILEKLKVPNQYLQYLNAVIINMRKKMLPVIDYWNGSGRPEWIENDGMSSNSSTNLMVNNYVKYFEKYLRAGKVGIPAGVYSGDPLPDRLEAFYSKQYSKELLLEALKASKAFFNGEGASNQQGKENLSTYLDFLNTMKDGANLSEVITNQFNVLIAKAELLNPVLEEQISKDNTAMLSLFDDMQKLVVLLKVDMMQAMNINVDYVDADGD